MGQIISAGTSTQPTADDGITWWFKFFARACGTIGGLLAIALGLFACITFSSACFAAGLIQMLFGFLTITLEAPCCCAFLDFIEKLAHFSESRPYWQKGLLYALISPIPVFMCFEVSTFFGSGLIFITGVVYGMMALGKKADRETMMARATSAPTMKDTMDVNLVDRDRQPTVLTA